MRAGQQLKSLLAFVKDLAGCGIFIDGTTDVRRLIRKLVSMNSRPDNSGPRDWVLSVQRLKGRDGKVRRR